MKLAVKICKTFPECALPSNVSKITIKTDIKSRCSLKRCDGQMLPYSNMPVLVLISGVIHRSTLHLAVAGSIVY